MKCLTKNGMRATLCNCSPKTHTIVLLNIAGPLWLTKFELFKLLDKDISLHLPRKLLTKVSLCLKTTIHKIPVPHIKYITYFNLLPLLLFSIFRLKDRKCFLRYPVYLLFLLSIDCPHKQDIPFHSVIHISAAFQIYTHP